MAEDTQEDGQSLDELMNALGDIQDSTPVVGEEEKAQQTPSLPPSAAIEDLNTIDSVTEHKEAEFLSLALYDNNFDILPEFSKIVKEKHGFQAYEIAIKSEIYLKRPPAPAFIIRNDGSAIVLPETGYFINILSKQSSRSVTLIDMINQMLEDKMIFILVKFQHVMGMINNQPIAAVQRTVNFMKFTDSLEEAYQVAHQHDAQVFLDIEKQWVIPIAEIPSGRMLDYFYRDNAKRLNLLKGEL